MRADHLSVCLCGLLSFVDSNPPLHRGRTYKISNLKQKCEAAEAIGCESVVVPCGNADESHSLPLIGVKDLKELLHHAFKDGGGKSFTRDDNDDDHD